MSMKLYAHPFSSYSRKVLIALYENETPFEFRMLAPDDEQTMVALERLWPFKRFPVLGTNDARYRLSLARQRNDGTRVGRGQ